ncbi:MAG: ketopantoate reductase family protein [Candidatus Saccharibacteria bacterium]
MRQAIMGAGSLGTILGALLTRQGYQIDLVDVWTEHVRTLNEKGAAITGKMKLNQAVTALTPDQMEGYYDIIYYIVKSTDNVNALPFVKEHLKTDGTAVVMQNGLPEENVAAVIGTERTVGCPIGWGATLIAPGVSELTSDPEMMTFDLGELDGSDTKRLDILAEILNCAGIAHKSNNLVGLRWSKLVSNCTFSAMSTLMGGSFGDVLDDEKALYCAATICKEALAVMAAADIVPELIQGADIRWLDFTNREGYQNLIPVYKAIFGPHRALKASMLQDCEKGKPCEIDNINGAISTWAARYGVNVPVNEQVTRIIKEIDQGKLKPSPTNLDLIKVSDLV